MPKRVIDFDAMWGSDKLASCAPWAQAEYAWLYGLADASGCFEITNLRVIWGRVAAIRANLTLDLLERIFVEFQDKGLLFVWEHEGKRYAHWTGSDVPGRLPPPSWRMRLERFAPPVPKALLAQYMGRFARGRAALAGVGFRGNGDVAWGHAEERRAVEGVQGNFKFEISDLKEGRAEVPELREPRGNRDRAAGMRDFTDGRGVTGARNVPDGRCGMEPRHEERVEEAQGQDLDLGWNLGWKRNLKGELGSGGEANDPHQQDFSRGDSGSSIGPPGTAQAHSPFHRYADENLAGLSAKELAVARELRVGQGPVCDPAGIRPEVIERARRRDQEQRERERVRAAGSRSP